VFESNFKIALNFQKIDIYFKLNDIFGRRDIRVSDRQGVESHKYSHITYNTNNVIGLSLDIDQLFNFSN